MNYVVVFNRKSGQHIRSFRAWDLYFGSRGYLQEPYGVAVSKSGDVFVSDTYGGNSRQKHHIIVCVVIVYRVPRLFPICRCST